MQPLGTLGKQEWYRCRACGMESSSRAHEEHEHEAAELKADAAARVIAEEGIHCLLLGRPGSGQTMIARRVAKYLGNVVLRAPHHTVSVLGMVGDKKRPGELGLVEGGVLYLEGADEFNAHALAAVQQAVEQGADFLVVASVNRADINAPGMQRFKKHLPAVFDSVWLVENLKMKR